MIQHSLSKARETIVGMWHNLHSQTDYFISYVFELPDEQVKNVPGIYKHMFEESDSYYIHKYDVLRNLVFELLHFAMKLPSAKIDKQPLNAAQRISSLFLELLER